VSVAKNKLATSPDRRTQTNTFIGLKATKLKFYLPGGDKTTLCALRVSNVVGGEKMEKR